MIQRSLLRHIMISRAGPLRSLKSRPLLTSPVVRRQETPSRHFVLSLRHYSSTTDAGSINLETEDATAKDSKSSPLEETQDPTEKELEAKNREIIDLKDKYVRSVADFRNLQDRTARDISSARDFAISRFAKDLLDSVDNFDRALSTVPSNSLAAEATNKELKDLHSGLKMTESILMQTLARNGLERFDPSEKGERFDPNLHEATFMTKMEDKEDGSVFNTIQKGFKLNGRVIRAAKVGVVKNT